MIFQYYRHIYRYCFSHGKTDDAQRPLSEAKCGTTLLISEFTGGRQFENRLRAMGLAIGDEITILNNAGPLIIAKGRNRLAIGAGMAEKIMIKIL